MVFRKIFLLLYFFYSFSFYTQQQHVNYTHIDERRGSYMQKVEKFRTSERLPIVKNCFIEQLYRMKACGTVEMWVSDFFFIFQISTRNVNQAVTGEKKCASTTNVWDFKDPF